jgi:hypothetical protein
MAGEYLAMSKSGANGANLVAIHSVGLGSKELDEAKIKGNKLVWSPLSNFMLYGSTMDIDGVRSRGIPLSLAPDWSPSGSKSSLGELKVADLVVRSRLKSPIPDRELAAMVTRNPAMAIGWGERLGQLVPGYLADLLVVDDRHADPYRNLIEAVEENIRAVLVDGVALYGDAGLMQVMRAADDTEDAGLFAARRPKRIAINCPSLPKTTLAELRATLQAALNIDPELAAKRLNPQLLVGEAKACNVNFSTPPTAEEAKSFIQCRFGLPFEKTTMSPMAVSDDPDFFPRLVANPNVPAYLKKLPEYWKK